MVFSSLIFLFMFLPAFMAVYYITPFRGRSLVILIGSAIFYAWWRIDFLFLLLGVKFFNYLIAKKISASAMDMDARRWLILGISGNLATLGLFKYFNFGIDTVNAILTSSGLNTIEAMKFILPIGISFAIFQCISFLIDIYRKDTPPPRSFIDFAAFVLLFPQLIAGPVLRYKDLAGQFQERVHSFDKFSKGAYRFMYGFAKKVLIADSVAVLVDKTYALENPSMGDAWLGALAYTVQLYFDFSGYSDMAIGLGLMMGFRFIENFNAPYISRSITEFWRRWHMSLSTWLRDYLYIPLGGNRKGRVRTYINLFLTMLLGGLWHGANWTFILWGAWHGALLAFEKFIKEKKRGELISSMPRQGASMILTFFLVVMGWVMFRAESVHQAFSFYHAMFGGAPLPFSEPLEWQITGVSLAAMVLGFLVIFLTPMVERLHGVNLKETRNRGIHILVIFVFIVAVIKLGAQSYSPFLYFQF